MLFFLLAKYTVWGGRQYWRITGDYFKGRQSIVTWIWVGVLLLSTIISVRLDVLLSYYSNDLYTSLQVAFQGGAGGGNEEVRQSGIHGFWAALILFGILATIYISRVMLDIYLMQRFIIRWRVWLTDRLTCDWLDDHAYYRTRFTDSDIDNPDQRIQQDIDIFTAGVGSSTNQPTIMSSNTLLFGAINSLVTVVSFTVILWNLSGPLTFLGGVTLGHALFWVVLVYVVFATIIAFWIGHPLIKLSFRNELTNAVFRYALVRLRDAAEAVGFYRGEKCRARPAAHQVRQIIANYKRYVNRTIALTGWNLSMSQIINPLPLVIQAPPRLFAGQIDLGDVTQSSSAFGSIHDSLSFFRNAYDSFASYRAAIIRLHGLVETNAEARELPKLTTLATHDGSVELRQVEVRTPSGTRLVDPIDLRLEPGETLVITGPFGRGQDHAAAQPGAAVAVHLGHPVPARRPRHHVPVADAVCAAGRPAHGGVLPPPPPGGRSATTNCSAR